MQNKGSETGSRNTISRLLGARAIGRFAYNVGFNKNACRKVLSFFILTLVVSLISTGILNANTTIGIDAFAKKSSKKIFDRSSNDGNSRTSGSTYKGSSLDGKDTSFNEDTKSTEPFIPPLPLPAETPTNSKYVIINFDDSHQSDYTYANQS